MPTPPFEVAARYHMYAALATIVLGPASERGLARGLVSRWPGWLMQVGIALFCGSLYALALTDVRGLGAITPIGGVCFLLAWPGFAKDTWMALRRQG